MEFVSLESCFLNVTITRRSNDGITHGEGLLLTVGYMFQVPYTGMPMNSAFRCPKWLRYRLRYDSLLES